MLGIVDYGMGNLRSVQKALETLGFEVITSENPADLAAVAGMILPGVGGFGDAMVNLRRNGLDRAIRDFVLADRPFLGICLGMQLLFSESEEDGLHQGLDLFPGRVLRLGGGVKVPHMGWNTVDPTGTAGKSGLLAGLPRQSYYYFVHSYRVAPIDSALVLATTEYGETFPVAVGRGRVFGVQFHPEKSSRLGLAVLKNFGELVRSGSNPGC